MNNTKSSELFSRAKNVMPGGVNSPVRAFKSVGIDPIFIKKAKGNKVFDVDGNVYLDYIGSWGPMVLGHGDLDVIEAVNKATFDGLSFGAATELEVNMAELIIKNIKPVEMIRMVSSGTESCMSAIRVARGYTKKDKVIKFNGCYHGHSDGLLVKAGSGALTFATPDSDGVTKNLACDTLVAEYNDLNSVEKLFLENKENIACIIVEPVAANMGVIAPADGFLEGLRALCDKFSSLLIFDEVITGFRLSFGGASEYYNVTPDLVTYGKIIGGGMPVGAYGGRREIMECVSPVGKVYQAGTLSGNPIALTAGMVTLNKLLNNNNVYENINSLGKYFEQSLKDITDYTINRVGSLVCLFFTKENVTNHATATLSDTNLYKDYFCSMLKNNIYIAPAQFEAMFISNIHTKEDIDNTVDIIKKIIK